MTVVGVASERALVDDALDAGTMAPRLQTAFGQRGGCRVLDAKYEAGSSCVVLYGLGDELVIGTISFAGNPMAGGVDVGGGIRAYIFPDDPRLPKLAGVMDGSALPSELGPVRVRLLRYRAGKRATVALDGDQRSLIGKVYAKPEKAAAVHEEATLLAPALAGDPAITVPTPAGFLPDVPMVLWEPVTGAELDPALDGEGGPGLVRVAAEAIAALHAAPVVSRRPRPVDAELARFRSRAGNIARVAPEEGTLLERVARAVAEAGTRLDHPEPSLVHGDCKPSQFRVSAEGVVLLDFDHCGLADPATDVGTFLASLRQHGRRGLEDDFLRAYVAASNAGDDVAVRARWYEAVALMRKALRAFARAPRSPIPGILAREALRCLES